MDLNIALLPDVFPWVWDWWHGILSGAVMALVMLVLLSAVLLVSTKDDYSPIFNVSTMQGNGAWFLGTAAANALLRLVGGYVTGDRAGILDVFMWGVYGWAGLFAFGTVGGLLVMLIVVPLAVVRGWGKNESAGAKPSEPAPKPDPHPPGNAP